MARKKLWRDVAPPHPASELFPQLDAEHLKELAADIQAHGLKAPIITWQAGSQTKPTGPVYVLDGRNRLDAMELLGWKLVEDGNLSPPNRRRTPEWVPVDGPWVRQIYESRASFALGDSPENETVRPSVDPYAYVISANVHRRHLTTAQKKEVAERLVQERPGLSNGIIASWLGLDRTVVHDVRQGLAAVGIPTAATPKRTGKDSKQYPSTRATKAEVAARVEQVAALKQQGQSNVGIAAQLGVSERTVYVDLQRAATSGLVTPLVPPVHSNGQPKGNAKALLEFVANEKRRTTELERLQQKVDFAIAVSTSFTGPDAARAAAETLRHEGALLNDIAAKIEAALPKERMK